MRRQIKLDSSKIIENNLEYISGGKNSILRNILFKEQKGFCAYTETYFGRSDQNDIDHFNPSKDFEDRNKYQNLFLCKALWNKEKLNKWKNFQPILHPTSIDFEERVVYNKDLKIFEAKDGNDIDALNLVKLLKLDEPDLANERKRYLKMMQDLSEVHGISIQELFYKIIYKYDHNHLRFLRSVQEEFGFDLWNMIPKIEI